MVVAVESFGALLRRLRSATGLTQEELAERAGLSTRAVSDLERGVNRSARKDTARLLADGLDLAEPARAEFLAAARAPLPGQPTAARVEASAVIDPAFGRVLGTHLPLVALVGRDTDVAGVCDLLTSPSVRLLTLTGPGGVGKTRLALQVAHHLSAGLTGGALWVDLAPLTSTDLVLPAIAATAGVRLTDSVAAGDQLASALKDRRMLLVLDNFEHLLGAAGDLVPLLADCPGLSVLVTSRVILRIPGEHEWRLAGLALPKGDEPDLLLAAPAVTLFVQRVRAVRPDFAADESAAESLADICRRLEGLPLAVELAARRLGVMSLAELRARLESRLALLTGGRRDAPAHQRTLRDTIRWSYDLLPADHQLAFRWLAVFQGGFDLTLAEDLLGRSTEVDDALDVLGELVDSSLLIRAELDDGTSRFGMLESIREFGVEQLSEQREQRAVSGHHAELMAAIAVRAAEGLTGAEQSSCLELLDRESANLRAALQYCRTARSAMLVPLATSLWRYWEIRGQLTEGRHWLESALAIAADGESGSGLPESLHAEACLAAAALARDQGDGPAAVLHCERALEIAESEGNQRISARAFNIQGNVALDEGRLVDAAAAHTRGMEMFAAVGDERGLALLRNNLGLDLAALGRREEALEHLQDSLRRFEELDDLRGVARALISLAAATAEHDPDKARDLYARALLSHRSIGDLNGIAAGLEGLGLIGIRTGQAGHAVRLLGAAHRLRRESGDAPAAEELRAVESALAYARIELGDKAFEEEWTEGAALPLTTVIGEALQDG